MKAVPLTECIGSEIEDVDLSNTSEEERSQIKQLLLDRGVLFFRQQSLSPEQQARFVSEFANIQESWMRCVYPNVFIVETRPDASYNYTGGFRHWHQDSTFFEQYPHGSLLYAQSLPTLGGDTLWSSTRTAFEAFPLPMQEMLLQLKAVHDSTLSRVYRLDPFMKQNWDIDSETARILDNRPCVHPVVVQHPLSDYKCLFVNRVWTSKIVGMDFDLSESILKLCYDWISKPRFQVRWRWQLGDVALYDNLSTAHQALHDYPDTRLMYRSDFRYD